MRRRDCQNDRRNLYPAILERAGLRLDEAAATSTVLVVAPAKLEDVLVAAKPDLPVTLLPGANTGTPVTLRRIEPPRGGR
jgi:hypothetical protein